MNKAEEAIQDEAIERWLDKMHKDLPITMQDSAAKALLNWLYFNPMPSPSPSEVEKMAEEAGMSLAAKIKQRMDLLPDEPTLSERGAYDAYVNILRWLDESSPSRENEYREALEKIVAFCDESMTEIKVIATEALNKNTKTGDRVS